MLTGELVNTSGARIVTLLEPTKSVWPSGGERTTAIAPIAPDPPGMFSRKNGWPKTPFI